MLASPMSWFGLQHRGLAHHRKAVILIAPERTEYPISSLNRVLRIVRLLVDGLHPQARERKELQVTRAPRTLTTSPLPLTGERRLHYHVYCVQSLFPA